MIASSKAVRAHRDGTIEFADGSTERASLVVAADGIRSPIRESLSLTQEFRDLGNGAIGCSSPGSKLRLPT